MITIKEGEIEKDETFSQSDCDSRSSQRLPYAKETSLSTKKFFRIFSRGIKSKVARIVFGALFLFLSMSGLCIGITQPISGSDGLIRKQADLLGVEFVQTQDKQDGSFLATRTTIRNAAIIFVDFEKEQEHFELIEGHFPTNPNEAIISEYKAKFESLEIGDNVLTTVNGISSAEQLGSRVICGIFKSDTSAYKFKYITPEDYEWKVYFTLTAPYCTTSFLTLLEEEAVASTNNSIVCQYKNEEIIAGRLIDDTAVESEVIVSTKYISDKYGYDLQDIKANPQQYFSQIDKTVVLNGYSFQIVGLYDNDYSSCFLKKGAILYLDAISGYVMPIDEIKKDNFKYSLVYDNTFISEAMKNDTNLTQIGLPVFAVFAVLAAVVIINLNIYEIDEKKALFRNMRLSGFSKRSLMAYNLVVDMMLVATALVLFLIVGLPIISHFQIVEREFDSIYIYALNGWAALIAIIATAAIAVVSYLITLKKFNRETDVCSK